MQHKFPQREDVAHTVDSSKTELSKGQWILTSVQRHLRRVPKHFRGHWNYPSAIVCVPRPHEFEIYDLLWYHKKQHSLLLLLLHIQRYYEANIQFSIIIINIEDLKE